MTRLLYWSSTENNSNNAYKVNFGNGNTNNNNKNNSNCVRAVRDFWQIDLFHQPIPLSDFYLAYGECRKNKRNTVNALSFEIDYEKNLQDLFNEVNSGNYQPRRSVAFIVNQPVKREVFAADFRDRIIHHLLYLKLNAAFERTFIYDSYSCRVGKGTHFAIRRVDHFIRSCSRNYTQDCYVLKLDISGFFMSIDRSLLWRMISDFIDKNYSCKDYLVVKDLAYKTILDNPAEGCIIKGTASDWVGLPPSKSLFHSPRGYGLPIGNLTSQVFANYYMNGFDHFVKHNLHIRYYGRYVDDIIIVHESKEYLQSLIPVLSDFLLRELNLKLNPKKIYLQHYSKGIKYLGCVIKPYRIYISNRTKGNFYWSIEHFNQKAGKFVKSKNGIQRFRSSVNSYLGLLSHYSTYFIRKREIHHHLSSVWHNRIQAKNYCRKIR